MEVASHQNEAMAFLMSRIDYERASTIPYDKMEFRLDRMRELLSLLDNPQERLKIVHVAGTKGKGSTSAMIASVLSAAGYRTGLYTSPHVDRVEERLIIDGERCGEGDFIALVERLRPIVRQLDLSRQRTTGEPGPTYFEITTAMALEYFAWKQTDFAVLEVGLGGRLDCTNVCQPLVSVITSISFDHTEILGNSLEEIASEKAGIIKDRVPVVSGVVEEEPRQVISNVALQHGCKLMQLGTDFSYEYYPPCKTDQFDVELLGTMDYDCSAMQLKGVKLALLGRHQAANAVVALTVLNELQNQGWPVPEMAIRRGLAKVYWPARVEIVGRQPTIVVDAAHNVASIQSLVATLKESFRARRRLLVFATTQGKDVRGMLQVLLPHFEAVILTRYVNNPRSVDPGELATLVGEMSEAPRFVCENPAAAWRKLSELITPDDLACITGSFFLAAEIRREITRSLIQPKDLRKVKI
jgi:dihydrofolate synthase / folylpolyglutamate synthase